MGYSLNMHYMCVLIFQMCIFLVVHGAKLRTWKAHRNCGFHISGSSPVGTIVFSVKELRAKLGYGECKLIVVPETLPDSHGNGKVLIYFTSFELPGTCSDFSVLLLDGSSHNAPRVAGAPDPLCSHNTSLTNSRRVFKTSGTEFTVLFRWKNSNSYTSGYVIFKFSSYFDGPCGDSDEVVTCVNKQCTDSAYHCHYDINTCGPEEEKVCEKLSGGFGAGLVRMVIALVVMVIIVGGVGFLCNHCGYGVWRCIRTCKRRRTGRNDQHRPTSINRDTVQQRERSRSPSTNRDFRQQRERSHSPSTNRDFRQQRERSRSPSTNRDFRQQRERSRSPSPTLIPLSSDTGENSLHNEKPRSPSINAVPRQQRTHSIPLSTDTMQIVLYKEPFRFQYIKSSELSQQSSSSESLYVQASDETQSSGYTHDDSINSWDPTDENEPQYFNA